MESVLGRYRNLIILVGVLFLQVLGLAMQVKKGNDAENTRLIRIWVVSTITPLERGLVWVENGAANLWHNYFYLRGVRAENRQLKDQIEHMRLEQVRLNEDAAQARRLQALLGFKEQFVSRTVAAQVIGSSGSDSSLSVYIDKGTDEGIQPDMAVITADGIVGKVLRVFPSTSLVLLINDQSSGVGAILEKTRLQGVLHGTPNGEVVLERVMSDEQVPVGETLLTSGGDRIFPKGLPVGTVAKVSSGKDLFLNIKIKPAANLSKLEEVLVVVQQQDRQATAEDRTRVRAADILAQRLPSVPDKAATNEKPAGGVPPANADRTGAGTTAVRAQKTAGNNAASSVPPAGQRLPAGAVKTVPSPKSTVVNGNPGSATIGSMPGSTQSQGVSSQPRSSEPRSSQSRSSEPRPGEPRPSEPRSTTAQPNPAQPRPEPPASANQDSPH